MYFGSQLSFKHVSSTREWDTIYHINVIFIICKALKTLVPHYKEIFRPIRIREDAIWSFNCFYIMISETTPSLIFFSLCSLEWRLNIQWSITIVQYVCSVLIPSSGSSITSLLYMTQILFASVPLSYLSDRVYLRLSLSDRVFSINACWFTK